VSSTEEPAAAEALLVAGLVALLAALSDFVVIAPSDFIESAAAGFAAAVPPALAGLAAIGFPADLGG
jgi:hypothetical protein